MFDPRSPYHRRRWHYDSDQPLSVAQLIAAGSLDARTAALLWVLVERHQSLIVSGPTDPTPGVGKTTTLNALLEFLPVGTTLVYTMGMYEDFDFLADTNPATTCVLANEVSDHLPIYMWGRVARRLLALPGDGYSIATSCHADTLYDVMRMLRRDLRLEPADIQRVGVIVNIGLVGRLWPPRRRFLTVNYAMGDPSLPVALDARAEGPRDDAKPGIAGTSSSPVQALRLAAWDAATDSFTPPSATVMGHLSGALGMTVGDLTAAVDRRAQCLAQLAAGKGAGLSATRQAIEHLMESEEQGASPSGPQTASGASN